MCRRVTRVPPGGAAGFGVNIFVRQSLDVIANAGDRGGNESALVNEIGKISNERERPDRKASIWPSGLRNGEDNQ